MTHFNIGKQNLGPPLGRAGNRDDESAHSSPSGPAAQMSAERRVPYRENPAILSIVAGVLRAWLFGFRGLTADMLDRGDIAKE